MAVSLQKQGIFNVHPPFRSAAIARPRALSALAVGVDRSTPCASGFSANLNGSRGLRNGLVHDSDAGM